MIKQTAHRTVWLAAGMAAIAPGAWAQAAPEPRDAASPALIIDGYLQLGVAWNSTSSAATRAAGNSSFPVAPGDEGFKLEDLHLHIRQPLNANLAPRIGPLPGPVPAAFSVGMEADLLYGRSGQPAAMYGFDKDWGINRPGNADPRAAALHRQNFLALPQLYLQAYFPIWQGAALTAGRFGTGIGSEIAPQHRSTPNVFYTRSYAYISQPQQVFGLLGSVNLVRSGGALVLGELGLVNGWQNLTDNNANKSVMAALRWRTTDMAGGINYAVLTGNEQNRPGRAAQLPISMVTSPRGQRRQHHSLNGYREFAERWRMAGELVYGSQAGDGMRDTVHAVTGAHFAGAAYRGINAILSYRGSAASRYSVRIEHFEGRDGFGLEPLTAVKSDFNAVTIGAQYDLNKQVGFRPEIRHDWQSRHDGVGAFASGKAERQTIVAMDAIFRF